MLRVRNVCFSLMNWETEMNLLWNLIVVLSVFLVFAVALAYLKQFFCDYPWRKRARLCYKQTKRWWKKDRDTWLKDVAIPKIKNVRIFIGQHWKPIKIIASAILLFLILILWVRLPENVFLALLLLTVVLRVIVWFRTQFFCDFPRYLKKRRDERKEKSENSETPSLVLKSQYEFLSKVVVPSGGVLAAVIVLRLALGQYTAQTENLEAQKIIAERQFTAELFKNAIDQLGSEQQPVVLGGVHALHHLAVNNPKDYSQPVFEILCSFIREKTAKTEYKEQFSPMTDSSGETQATSLIVIQTIVDKLFREEEARKFYQVYRANLSGASLQKVDFTNASLRKADLQKADLQGVNLIDAKLHEANLQNANLQEVKLFNATLQGADLQKANLQGAKLFNANLQGVDLRDANLHGAVLTNVNLHGAELSGADLRGVQCNSMNNRETISDAIKDKTPLKTDLSGITLYDDKGNALDLDEDGKKAWFRERGANVDDLGADKVQELFKDFKWE